MAASLTAVDVLNLVLVVGFLAALFGWAGGKGALRSLRADMLNFEGTLEAFDRRIKQREGTAGQAATQRRRTELQTRDDEADKLAQALARGGGRRRGPAIVTEQDAEEAAITQLEQEARAKGLMSGKVS